MWGLRNLTRRQGQGDQNRREEEGRQSRDVACEMRSSVTALTQPRVGSDSHPRVYHQDERNCSIQNTMRRSRSRTEVILRKKASVPS